MRPERKLTVFLTQAHKLPKGERTKFLEAARKIKARFFEIFNNPPADAFTLYSPLSNLEEGRVLSASETQVILAGEKARAALIAMTEAQKLFISLCDSLSEDSGSLLFGLLQEYYSTISYEAIETAWSLLQEKKH
ncbi:MAG TPA: hypothetical protein VI957_03565 [Candidatus Paceibacterota bacterium]